MDDYQSELFHTARCLTAVHNNTHMRAVLRAVLVGLALGFFSLGI